MSAGRVIEANKAVFRKLGHYSIAMIALPLITYFALHDYVLKGTAWT